MKSEGPNKLKQILTWISSVASASDGIIFDQIRGIVF